VIDRYCFVKLKDAHVANREALAEALHAMLDGVDGVASVTIGLPADDSAARWDLSLVVRTLDLGRWREVEQDEGIREVFDGWLPEHAEVVKAWTFVVD
jgi:hypothetical protein